MRHAIVVAVMIIAAFAAGCNNSPRDTGKVTPLSPASDTVKQRSAELRSILAPSGKPFGMFISIDTVTLYWAQPELLSERLVMAGVTDAHFDIRIAALDDPNYYPAIRRIIAELHTVAIRCHLVIEDEQLYSAENVDHDGRKVVKAVKNYNWHAPRSSEFDGITATVNPHHINSSNTYLKRGLLFSWQESNYGKNNENDLIMRQAFQILAEMRTAAAPLTFTVMTESFYHERVKKGDLSLGSINDFANASDQVIVTAYGKYANEVFSLIKEELRDCKKNNSVTVCLKTDRNIYGESAEAVSIARKRWPKAIAELTALVKALSTLPAYRGLACMDYAGFEMLLEKNE